MEKDVIISIKGTQKYDGGEPGAVELVTAGRLAQDEAGYTLSYQESELTGLEGTMTTIQVEGEQVTLMRVGEFNTQMVFREGRRHLSMYNTPYGAMAIGVNTRHLLADTDGQRQRNNDNIPCTTQINAVIDQITNSGTGDCSEKQKHYSSQYCTRN